MNKKNSRKKVRSVRVVRSLDFLNLTDVVRELEDFADKIDYANDIKKNGNNEKAENIIDKARKYMTYSLGLMINYALLQYKISKGHKSREKCV